MSLFNLFSLRLVKRTTALSLRMMASLPNLTAPSVVKVRSLEESDKLNVMFEDSLGHQYQLCRDKKEEVSKTLTRIILSYQKKEKKGRKRKRADDAVIPGEAHLYTPTGAPVSGEVPNVEAWKEGSILELGSIRYQVTINLATVLNLALPDIIMTDCPAVPRVDLEFSNFDLCLWEWFICPKPLRGGSPTFNTPPDLTALQRVSTARVYWPSDSDAGCRLLIRCTPICADGRHGEPVTKLSTAIRESPKVTPITRRHLLTPARLARPEAFRMVSYNTLAGAFTVDDYSHRVLYPYCDPAALDIKYRQCRILHELIGYNADVLSLQEVGTSTFDKFFLPTMRDKGYDGCHQPKAGSTINEGEAIFYDSSRFSLVAQESTCLSDFFSSDPSCAEMLKELEGAPIFLNQVKKKSTIVLVLLLRSLECPGKYLLVANTHLYYHPKGDHVRLVQSAIMVNYLRTRVEKFAKLLREEGDKNARIATVIAGDLNSCPCIAAYDYLVKGSVGRDHNDWMGYRRSVIPRCPCHYKHNGGQPDCSNSGPEILPPHIEFELERQTAGLGNQDGATTLKDTFSGMELRHDFHFENVTGTEVCTNYTAGFKAVLDYIMIDKDGLEAERVVPLPSLEEVSEFVALPSVYFPSDHLALIADLKWKL